MKTVTKILAVIIAAMCVISCFAGCEKVVEDTEAVQGVSKSHEYAAVEAAVEAAAGVVN